MSFHIHLLSSLSRASLGSRVFFHHRFELTIRDTSVLTVNGFFWGGGGFLEKLRRCPRTNLSPRRAHTRRWVTAYSFSGLRRWIESLSTSLFFPFSLPACVRRFLVARYLAYSFVRRNIQSRELEGNRMPEDYSHFHKQKRNVISTMRDYNGGVR